MPSDIDRAILVRGRPQVGPAGLRIVQALPYPTGRPRSANAVNEIVVHESVTRSTAATDRVLRARGLGVHLMVDPDGTVYQHGDLGRTRYAHASGHNGCSVGIEVVNPYYPKWRDKTGLTTWPTVIDAPWAHRGRYTVPPIVQVETVARLIAWLTSPSSTLAIPRKWVGVRDGKIAMGRVEDGDERQPGIWAHHYSGHADGAWPVLYARLRLGCLCGCSAEDAYEESMRLATGATGAITLPE